MQSRRKQRRKLGFGVGGAHATILVASAGTVKDIALMADDAKQPDQPGASPQEIADALKAH